MCGAPGATRTPDTRFRKPLLYPTELQGHGGDRGIRTPDLCDANAALSQLSYIPKFNSSNTQIMGQAGYSLPLPHNTAILTKL
jgi:hypothetical protein